MDKKLFRELTSSINEAGKVLRGEIKPGVVHYFSSEEVKRLRSANKRVNKSRDRNSKQ